MFPIIQNERIICMVLGNDDRAAFVEARSTCWLDKTPEDGEAIRNLAKCQAAIREDACGYWAKTFQPKTTSYFVLYEKPNSPGQNRVIGMADIDFNGQANPFFTNLYILREKRGNNLSTYLHQARIDYIENYTNLDRVVVLIAATNKPSLAAAQKNGFSIYDRCTGLQEEEMLLLQRTIQRANNLTIDLPALET